MAWMGDRLRRVWPGKGNGDAGGNGRRDVHLGEPGFLSKLVRRRRLESLFLFVTGRCNSNCRTCFYAGKMDAGADLSFEQLEELSRTAPRFDKLWLSGGEPFLRSDLVDIIALFHRTNGIQSINLPTNGLLPERILDMCAALLERCPKLNVHLNFSLDGLGAKHDRVRGVPGAFATTAATMDRVRQRFGGHPRLLVNVASVVTPEALDDMPALGAYLQRKGGVATHFFEAVRGQPRDPATKGLSPGQLERLHAELMPLYERMADGLFDQIPAHARWFAKLYFMGVIRFAYDLQEANLQGPAPWGMDCTAGQTTAVIDHDGALRACEMRPPVARLQDFDCDLGAALGSAAWRREVRAIGGGGGANCWCTHTCWVLSSMKFSPATLLYRVPRAWLRARQQARCAPGLPAVDPARIEQQAAATTTTTTTRET